MVFRVKNVSGVCRAFFPADHVRLKRFCASRIFSCVYSNSTVSVSSYRKFGKIFSSFVDVSERRCVSLRSCVLSGVVCVCVVGWAGGEAVKEIILSLGEHANSYNNYRKQISSHPLCAVP